MTSEDLAAARLALSALDAGLARAHSLTPPFAWRRREAGFQGLFRIIVEQQISTAAAAAIWGRCAAGLGALSPEAVLAIGEDALKGFGLSGPKVRHARALAAGIAAGAFDPLALRALSDEEALGRLVAAPGIGPWSAAIYLLFCEGRPDLCPEGDLALREALRRADGAATRLSEEAFRRRAEGWRPYRGAAAHLLWAFYRTGEGAPSPRPRGVGARA